MLFIILLSVPFELGTVLLTMRCKIFLPLLLFTVVTALLPAQAQVQRCTDARTGKVTYTDGSCSADQRSQEVVPALSPQEKAAQERQYEEAQARWQVEQARTQAQRRLEAEKAAAQAAAAAARQPPVQIIQPPANPVAPARWELIPPTTARGHRMASPRRPSPKCAGSAMCFGATTARAMCGPGLDRQPAQGLPPSLATHRASANAF